MQKSGGGPLRSPYQRRFLDLTGSGTPADPIPGLKFDGTYWYEDTEVNGVVDGYYYIDPNGNLFIDDAALSGEPISIDANNNVLVGTL